MSLVHRFALVFVVAAVSACGTMVSETRMAQYPSRGDDCALEFVQTTVADLAPGSTWEVVGYVVVSETGVADPFAEKYRALVRPRACAMGGEAVTIMQSSTGGGMAGMSGSSVNYAVIKHPSSEAAAPTAF